MRLRALAGVLGRSLVALLLLGSLALGFLPLTGPCSLETAEAGAPPCLMRLHLCGAADYALGSLADQSILRSEALLPLPPPPLRGEPATESASLPEGYPPPVYRPPRPAA